MRRRHGKRARLGGLLMAALGALAILALPAAAAAKDRNHDHIPDRWEKRHHLSTSVNQGSRDQDRDHLNNRGEFKAGDNPRDRDTDDDGIVDGSENAGTIASYDTETGKLTITLFGGDTVSGFVTEDTRIRCEMESHNTGDESTSSGATVSSRGENESGDDSGGDNSGPGNGDETVSDDPPNHDENDDHGEGDDDPANHEAGDDNDHENHGGDDGNRGPGNDNGFNCTPAALVVGATVDEAELELRNGKATFEEIELEHSSSQSTP